MPNRVAIVGAGIGGLTTAIACARVGWSVTALEKAEALEPVGAGIVLAPNAMRALATIGVADAILKTGHPQLSGAVRTSTGTVLQHIASAVGSDGTPTIAIRRADLVRILVDALPSGALRLGTEVTGVRQTGSGVVMTSTAGEIEAELAVGADGIHSLVRRELFPQHPPPAFAGFTARRAVVDAPAAEASESWGGGRLFGVVPLSNSRTYVYATVKTSAGQRAALSAGELRARFAAWHAPIPALLESLVDSDVLAHDVYWLKKPLPAFHSGRVAVVGDAAHAMTPNLGQGACQAIEDAVTLATCVGKDQAAGLARYTAERRPRTRAIARQSRLVSTVAHWVGPLGTLRNVAIRLAAPRAAARSARGVIDWVPPRF